MLKSDFEETQNNLWNELILEEYRQVQENIRSSSERLFVIKGWAITITTALLSYGVVENEKKILYACYLVASMFLIIELDLKVINDRFIQRSNTIEKILSNKDEFEYNLRSGTLSDHFKFPDIIGIKTTPRYAASSRKARKLKKLKAQLFFLLYPSVNLTYVFLFIAITIASIFFI